jgi:hypothetical protein
MAHAAFAARISDSRGAPDVLQADFLIEHLLDTPGFEEPVYLGRDRDGGVRSWLKHSSGDPASAARIAAEAKLLPRLDHPHVIRLLRSTVEAQTPWLAYMWQAEAPMNPARLAGMPAVNRARLAQELLDTVGYLQDLAEPVAHQRLELGALWVSSELCWLRLAQFGEAATGASLDELMADRNAAVRLILQLAQPEGKMAHEIELTAQAWIDRGEDTLLELKRALKLLTLERITEDL